MATQIAYRPVKGDDYTALPFLAHLDGEPVTCTVGATISAPAGFFATPCWARAAFLICFSPRDTRKLVIVQYDDATDVLASVDGGPGTTGFDHDLGDWRTDHNISLGLSAGQVIDEFGYYEACALAGRCGSDPASTNRYAGSVSDVFAAHGLTRVDPPGTTGR